MFLLNEFQHSSTFTTRLENVIINGNIDTNWVRKLQSKWRWHLKIASLTISQTGHGRFFLCKLSETGFGFQIWLTHNIKKYKTKQNETKNTTKVFLQINKSFRQKCSFKKLIYWSVKLSILSSRLKVRQ